MITRIKKSSADSKTYKLAPSRVMILSHDISSDYYDAYKKFCHLIYFNYVIHIYHNVCIYVKIKIYS